MLFRPLVILFVLCLTSSCGGDKHLPSSNPPEYDPKKVTAPTVSSPQLPPSSAKSPEPEPPPVQFPSLEPAPHEKGEWRKGPVKPESLQPFKGAKTMCDALSQLVQGLGSAQLFAGTDGAMLKKALGAEAEAIARRLDEELAESLKQSLGPTATHCSLPARPRKSMNLYDPYQAPRIVLTHGSSNASFLLAQATLSQSPGAAREFPPQVQEAPPGWVGKKTTRRTAGNDSSRVLVLGGKVRKCSSPEGEVPGDFQLAVVLDQTSAGSGGMRTVHIGLHASATMKGQVGDDAKIQYIEVNLSTVAERGGTEVPASVRRHRSQFRFVPSQDEFWPGLPTNVTGLSEAGWDLPGATRQEDSFVSDAAAAVMLWGGQTYLDAQKEWRTPNTCVEITFAPATKTRRFRPNESYPVKTELKTRNEQAVVPATFKEAKERPREGNGQVSPREVQSEVDRPATFTYRTPATRVRHSGFWVGAVSRAGTAEALAGEWEVADAGLRLKIANRIQADPQSNKAKIGMAQFDGTVQFEIPLEPVSEGMFRGEMDVVRPMVVRHVRPAATPCSGSGSQTEHWILSAQIDPKADSIVIQFGFTTSDEHASWTCGGITDELNVDLFGILESVHMPTKTGVKKDFTARNQEFLEWLSVTVVEGLD